MDATTGPRRRLALTQAAYYIVTGVWPLLHLRSFEWVSGPKTDRWLVKAVGVLVTAIGVPLGVAGWRRTIAPETALLATGSALGLAAVDVVYVAKQRISPIYLLDAVAEVGFGVGWLRNWPRAPR